MALYQPSSARARMSRSPQAPRLAADPRCPLLRPKERLSLAHATPRVPAVEDRLRLVQEMALRRYVGATERGAARTPPAGQVGQESPPQRRHSGLPDGQDPGGWEAESAASTPPSK